MRKSIYVIAAGVMAFSLAACGSENQDGAKGENVQETAGAEVAGLTREDAVGLPNPMTALDESEIPFDIVAPEGATNVKWSKIDFGDEPIIQLTFDYVGQTFTAREQVTGDYADDISGMYYDWTASEDVFLEEWEGGQMPATLHVYVGDDESAQLISWYNVEIGISYSLSTTGADLDGLDITVVANAIHGTDFKDVYIDSNEEDEHQPLNIEGCETFTQIVDLLVPGWGYANATIDGEDVLLVTGYTYTYDENGLIAAIESDVFYYKDGAPTYAGFVSSAGTAYPVTVKDGKLFVAGNHFVSEYGFKDGELVVTEENHVIYDENGDGTYFTSKDGGEEEQVADDSALNAAYDKMFEGDIVMYNVIQ